MRKTSLPGCNFNTSEVRKQTEEWGLVAAFRCYN